ncbi:hypothetical protein ACKC9G_05340 [Pokkaliibacter sp. CJK22405]|uniref:hypothetical protein n=1 Tax=Pokkaliibacter sp. CJK22405 TaxID=3384615 RepID=UPI003984783B
MQTSNILTWLRTHRATVAGSCLLAMLISFLLSQITPISTLPSTLFAWLAFIFFWPALPRINKQQSLALMSVGLIGAAVAHFRGDNIPLSTLLGNYLSLISMLTAVSFLKMMASGNQESLPRGKKGIVSTLAASHLLGAVLNLSILVIMGDRLARQGKITLRQGTLIGRGFTFAALWSPFFVAMNVSLLASPGMTFIHILPVGLTIALIALVASTWRMNRQWQDIEGYPLDLKTLLLPVGLAIIVITCHEFFPQVSVTLVITLVAPITALLFLGLRQPSSVPQKLEQHVSQSLGRMGGEVALFLAAGVLSSGLMVMVKALDYSLPIHHFGALQACILLVVMILLAWTGIHAMISVAVSSPLLLPMHPNPDMLGFMYLSAWALGSGSSPLSGMNLMLGLRFQIPAKGLWRNQAPFVMAILPVLWAALFYLDY